MQACRAIDLCSLERGRQNSMDKKSTWHFSLAQGREQPTHEKANLLNFFAITTLMLASPVCTSYTFPSIAGSAGIASPRRQQSPSNNLILSSAEVMGGCPAKKKSVWYSAFTPFVAKFDAHTNNSWVMGCPLVTWLLTCCPSHPVTSCLPCSNTMFQKRKDTCALIIPHYHYVTFLNLTTYCANPDYLSYSLPQVFTTCYKESTCCIDLTNLLHSLPVLHTTYRGSLSDSFTHNILYPYHYLSYTFSRAILRACGPPWQSSCIEPYQKLPHHSQGNMRTIHPHSFYLLCYLYGFDDLILAC